MSRQRIVAGALRLVDELGLDGLTTRGLGAALGCEAMSVYHHFPSKRHLQDAMVEHAIAAIPDPPRELDAMARLAFLGREYLAMARRHPRLLPLVALHRLDMPAGTAFVERMLGHFRAAIPDDRLAAQAFRVFGHYVTGAALGETSGPAAAPTGAKPDARDRVEREYPRLAAAAPVEPQPADSTFDLGLGMMLSGIAELRAKCLAQPRGAPKPVVHPKR